MRCATCRALVTSRDIECRRCGAPLGPRLASLDGIRGFALVAVLGYHAAPSVVRGGFLGVDVFFVLSGFLLGTVLLGEHRRRGRIDKWSYAVRRVRRIAPALFVLLAGLILVVPVLRPGSAHQLGNDVTWAALGLTNWHLIAQGSSYFTRFEPPSYLRHLWSVAVEIQFYVAFPFVVAALVRVRRAAAVAVLGLGIATSTILMAVLARGADPSRAYFGTETRFAALLVGALVAFAVSGPKRRQLGRGDTRYRSAARGWAGVACLVPIAVLVLLVMLAGERTPGLYRGGFLLAEGSAALAIWAALRPGYVDSVFGGRALRWLGQRSYGIYLWHWPLVVLLRPGTAADWPVLPAALVSVAGALILGAASYRFVERPFLEGRRAHVPPVHRALGHATTLATAVAVVITLATVRVPPTDPLVASLRHGQRVLAAQTHPTPAAVTTTTSAETPLPDSAAASSAAVPVSPPAPAPPSPAATSVTTTLIGDSVMITAAATLRARLGDAAWIDAKQNRQFSAGVSILRDLRERGGLGQVVVLALGNNGPVTAAQVDAVMTELAGGARVLLVTVRVSRSWQDGVNETLRAAAARNPTVTIVDWWGASAGHPDWFQPDGTHFPTDSGPGARAYANLIADAVIAP
jgi:peptidoglycan/LPS O-acetylase OafA/YrhL